MQCGDCTYFSFTKRDLNIHRSVAHNGVDLLALYDSTLRKSKKSTSFNWRGAQLNTDHVTACNAEHFLASSPLHNVNQQLLTTPWGEAGFVSLFVEKSWAEKSVSHRTVQCTHSHRSYKVAPGRIIEECWWTDRQWKKLSKSRERFAWSNMHCVQKTCHYLSKANCNSLLIVLLSNADHVGYFLSRTHDMASIQRHIDSTQDEGMF